MSRRVTIVGSGGVAEALAKGVARCEKLELVQVWGRNDARVEEISKAAGCYIYKELKGSDIYIVSVSDRAIAEVVTSLNAPQEAIIVHTAGSVDMDIIEHPRRGVLYPLQSFTPHREVNMEDVPLFVEGSSQELIEEVEQVAKMLSHSVMRLDSEGRKNLHLCGVFASNFTNAIYAAAADIAKRSDIPFDLLKPLIRESVDKAMSVDDPRTVQTGPAVRGDMETQQRHIDMLSGEERLQEIYKILSLQIWETSKKM